MRKLLKVLSIALLFPALLVGQQATLNSAQPNQAPISATAITLLPTVQPPVPSGSVARLGNPGQRTFYYWVVASGSFLSSAPAGPFELDQAPNLYGTGIGAQISWAPSVGALAYDVLRTTTPVPPSGSCNCAVATLLYGATSYTDISESLSAYTVTSVDPAAYAVQLTNQGGSLSLSNPFSAPSISSPSITTTGSEYFYRQGYLSNPTTDGQLMYRSSGLAPTGYGRWVYYSARFSGSGVRTLVPAEDVYGDGSMNQAGYFQNTGLNGNPYCAGFSPADGQMIAYSASGNCWTAAASSGALHKQVFTSSGTFTIPAGAAPNTAFRWTIAGGGGSGGGYSSGSLGGGGGGGAGATCKLLATGYTAGNTITITVGAASGSSNIASGTQTITTVTASAGGNGGNGANTSPGQGGGCANGDSDSSTGGDGTMGMYGGYYPGGNGGASTFGGGAHGAYYSTSAVAGWAAFAWGSGGGGGNGTNGSFGGSGKQGIVIVEWVQ